MKQQVLRIVEDAVAGAADNLNRAKAAYIGKSEEEMGLMWGLSGRSCRDILNEYEQHHDELKRCVEWVESK